MLRNLVLHLHFTKSLENYREMKTFWKVTDSGFYPTIRSVAEMRKFQEFAYPDVSVAIHKLLLTQCQDMKFYICLRGRAGRKIMKCDKIIQSEIPSFLR